jgi:hypothetical protein
MGHKHTVIKNNSIGLARVRILSALAKTSEVRVQT